MREREKQTDADSQAHSLHRKAGNRQSQTDRQTQTGRETDIWILRDVYRQAGRQSKCMLLFTSIFFLKGITDGRQNDDDGS